MCPRDVSQKPGKGIAMKRSLWAAVLVVALVLGVAAYASAVNTGNVAVSATVNPQISLTIAEDAASATWGTLTPGTAVGDKIFNFEVKSNKGFQFTNDSITYSPNDGLFDAVLSEAYSGTVVPGATLAKGISTGTANYSLDMVGAGAYDLDPTASYSATYVYTATQTP